MDTKRSVWKLDKEKGGGGLLGSSHCTCSQGSAILGDIKRISEARSVNLVAEELCFQFTYFKEYMNIKETDIKTGWIPSIPWIPWIPLLPDAIMAVRRRRYNEAYFVRAVY
eukprot:1358892-Amorphochlora_amoeboformis.AAC.1